MTVFSRSWNRMASKDYLAVVHWLSFPKITNSETWSRAFQPLSSGMWSPTRILFGACLVSTFLRRLQRIHNCNVLQFADDKVIFLSSMKVCDIEYLIVTSTSTRTNWLLTSKRGRQKVCCLGQQNVFHLSPVIREISSCSSMIIQSTSQTPTLI